MEQIEHMEQHSSEYPLLSIIFTVISMYTWFMSLDLQTIDNGLLLPFAHLLTICSGTCAVVLFFISIYEKYIKRKRR